MTKNSYDVMIIGAGVVGTSIARLLSSYKLNVVLVEKEADASFGVSKSNSGIIHAGFHHKHGTLKAKLEVRGNHLYENLHKELHFPFKRVGLLVVAFSSDEMKSIEKLYTMGNL